MICVQLPDTSIDQANMQLSRSYLFGNAFSSSNGTLIQVYEGHHLEKFWRTKTRDIFGKRSQENLSATVMVSKFEPFLFEASFLAVTFASVSYIGVSVELSTTMVL